jgi:hypothetical protein
MNRELKKESHILCEKIKMLSEKIDKNISKMEETNFLFRNVKINPMRVEVKEKEIKPAGKKSERLRLDKTIIKWKNSLRFPY